jgi:hypothetical protein
VYKLRWALRHPPLELGTRGPREMGARADIGPSNSKPGIFAYAMGYIVCVIVHHISTWWYAWYWLEHL